MIHIKVQYENEYRRFVHDGASYSKLQSTIIELYQIPLEGADLVLKYLDEENELVTFSTDFELETAMTLTPNLLRIMVYVNRPEIENEETERSPVEHYQEDDEEVDALADLPPWLRKKIRIKRACNDEEIDNEDFTDLPPWIRKRILKVRGQWDKDACPRKKWKKDGKRRWKGGRHGCHGHGHGFGHGNGRGRGRGRRGRGNWHRGWEISTESESSSSSAEMTLTEIKAEIASLKGEKKVLSDSHKEVLQQFRAQKAAIQEARRNGESPEYVTELRSQLDVLKQEKINRKQILRATNLKLKELNFKRKELVILARESAGEESE